MTVIILINTFFSGVYLPQYLNANENKPITPSIIEESPHFKRTKGKQTLSFKENDLESNLLNEPSAVRP